MKNSRIYHSFMFFFFLNRCLLTILFSKFSKIREDRFREYIHARATICYIIFRKFKRNDTISTSVRHVFTAKLLMSFRIFLLFFFPVCSTRKRCCSARHTILRTALHRVFYFCFCLFVRQTIKEARASNNELLL